MFRPAKFHNALPTFIAVAFSMAAVCSVDARVTKIVISQQTTPIFAGRSFGSAGPYEQIKGTAIGEIDPNDRRNAVITDIELAPRNAHPRNDTFRVPAVTITWAPVEIVAHGSSTVAFAVDIVRFELIESVPVKLRASHVPPNEALSIPRHDCSFAPKFAPGSCSTWIADPRELVATSAG